MQANVELITRVHKSPPGAVFLGIEPVRFGRNESMLLKVDTFNQLHYG